MNEGNSLAINYCCVLYLFLVKACVVTSRFLRIKIILFLAAKDQRLAVGITPGPIRISVGLEYADDIAAGIIQPLE